MAMTNIGFYAYLKDYSFSPTTLSLLKGDWVTFQNVGQVVHIVKSDFFESPDLLPGSGFESGQSFQQKFDKVGDFEITDPKYDNMFLKVSVLNEKDYKSFGSRV